MKNAILRLIIFSAILFIILEALSFIFIPNKSNLLQFGYYNKTKYDLLSEPNNTVDAVFLGDSIIYNGISPMHIWKNYGYTTYDCALPAATMDEIYEYANLIVKSQHPKIVIFEGDTLFRNPHTIHKYKITLKNMKKAIPLFTFHNNWKQLGSDTWINQYKGFKYSSKVKGPKRVPVYKFSNHRKEITDYNKEVFKNMVELFQKNDIELVLMEIPNVYWTYEKHNSVLDLAQKYNLEYFQVTSKDLNLDWFTETKDDGVHMNYKGALKLSDYVANYIKSKNILVDHRKDPNYDSWDKAYEIYSRTLYD